MQIKFQNQTNADIDRLVKISWDMHSSHENELFLIPERDEEDLVEFINDEIEKDDEGIEEQVKKPSKTIDLSKFSTSSNYYSSESSAASYPNRLLIAVDSGIVHLGEFMNGGIACAIRGAAICFVNNEMIVLRYNTGPLLIDESNSFELFRFMGSRLGNETLYLTKLDSGELTLNNSILGNTNQIQDRFRNFVERMIQEEALGILVRNQKGILMLDGALPAGTFDTPATYMRDMLFTAVDNWVDIIAISKKTKIRVNGKPINALFDNDPELVGFMPLKEVIAKEREKMVQLGQARDISAVTLGNEIFAVRFGLGPPAATFRVDVHNSKRSTPSEVLSNTINQSQIHGCYPRPLIDAHQYSSFLFQDVQLMTADLVARTGARPKEDQSMGWMFEPFGAFGK